MFIESTGQLGYIPKKIISLVPSQTELLHYLGLEAETIAITKFCVHPSTWFQNKMRIGGTKALDIDKIKSLEPDLIIANKEENVKDQIESLSELCPIWVTDVNNLEDANKMIQDIGTLTGKFAEALQLVSNIKKKFKDHLRDLNFNLPAAYLIWKDPYMTIGGDTFISSMMDHAGFENVYKAQERYPTIQIKDIKRSSAQVLLLSSEPYPFQQKHLEELHELLPAIKIILVDGEIFSWYGSRLLMAPDYFEKLRNEFGNKAI
ncbi:MAG: helical backbone metal receptor [Ferruginibacter sp.]